MRNLCIGLLLHFYQPWWQFPHILEKIVNQCYRPILALINSIDGFVLNVNINLSLLELLENDFPDVVLGFRKAIDEGKIQLMHSTAQHPILPLLSDRLKVKQILSDRSIKEIKFGLRANCDGIYLPEMAFSRRDVPLIRGLGCKWTVVDDEPVSVVGSVPFNSVTSYNGMKIFLRSGHWSNMIARGNLSFQELKSKMECEIPNWTGDSPAYIIIAMDAETFGHHDESRGARLIPRLLEPMLREWSGKKIVPLESIGKMFPSSSTHLPDCSWSTSADDVRNNDPYPLWNSRFNDHHAQLWELVNCALQYYDSNPYECMKMTSSCHWWHISRRPYWNPEFMQYGAEKAVRMVRLCGSPKERERAEGLYDQLKVLR